MTEKKKLAVDKIINIDTLKADTSFSDTDLSTPMMDQASLYAHYANLSAQASHQVDQFKMRLELQSATLDKEIRDAAQEAEEKLTEGKITAAICRDARYRAVLKMLNEAKMISSISKGALEALVQRRDMLVQIGVTLREEMKGDMRMKEIESRQTNSTSLRERAISIASKK